MILAPLKVSLLISITALLAGCASVQSASTGVINAVGTTVLTAGENMTSTVTQANTSLNSAVSTTVETTVETANTTVSLSAVTVGEITGITTFVKAGMQMTPRQSYTTGRLCAEKVLSTQEPIRSDKLADYVNTLGKYLAMHSQTPFLYKGYQFVVLENPVPNAVSTPGGFVFITTGMLALAESEDELAAVLAHEIAHISLKHAEQAIQTANQLDLFGGVLFKTAGYATQFATEKTGLDNIKLLDDLKVLKVLKIFDAVTDVVLNTAFNQPQELEADREAVSILQNAGYSPSALAGMLSKLSDDTSLIGLHPGSAERIRIVRREIGKNRTLASEARSDETLLKIRRRFELYKSFAKPSDTVDDRY